jgi:hypothetical protein
MDNSESPWTEITIQPDGRIYVFGLSKVVMEVLSAIPTKEPTLRDTWEEVQRTDLADKNAISNNRVT